MYKRGKLKEQKSVLTLCGLAVGTSSSISVPVNRFSVKYYGSVRKVEMERRRQQRVGRFVIHPHSRFRFFWDIISLFLLIISILVIPIAITFFSDMMSSDPGWLVFNFFLDAWFLIDIILNFNTGYIRDNGEGDIILDPAVIRRNYVKSWFIIDLLSAIPFDYILHATSIDTPSVAASRAMKLFRFTKVASLLRLLRISRLIRYVHQFEQVLGLQYDLAVAAMRVFNLVCLILLIGHWNGCLQFLVPMINNFPNDSWIVIDKLMYKPWSEQYSWCLFKAMSHMLCIGYGQLPPKNMTDLWMTMLSMMTGAVCFAMFIGHITALIQSMDSSERQYKEKYTQVKEYMRYRRLPESLRNRVFKYYEHRFQGKMFDEQGILDELSSPLREDVINFNCRHLVSSVPFFKNAEADFVTEVVQKLNFEVFQPKGMDVIVKEGAVGRTMYFIQQGLVEVRKSDSEKPIKQLADGSFFGEICLIVDGRRVASVIAISYCHTYSLHADDLTIILTDHPIMKKTLEQVAADRLKHIGHKNEVLDERLREADDFHSQASTLAAKIAKHDQTSTKTLKQSNEYFQPLKFQGGQLKWVPAYSSAASLENADDSNREGLCFTDHRCGQKCLNKSYSTLSQPVPMVARLPNENEGCTHSFQDFNKGGSCGRMWNSLGKLPNRDRSLSLKTIRIPKWRGVRSPFQRKKKCFSNGENVQSKINFSQSSSTRTVLYRKQNIASTSKSEQSAASFNKEDHIVVHMQDYSSPYADFTGYISSPSFEQQLRKNSTVSVDQDESTSWRSCSLVKDDTKDSSTSTESLAKYADENPPCFKSKEVKRSQQQLRNEIKN